MTAPETTFAPTPLLDASRAEVERRFRDADTSGLTYHSLAHTREVAQSADLLARVEQLPPDEHEDLLLAAWWHDVGMLDQPGTGHERLGARAARAFLEEQGVPVDRVDRVCRLIEATELQREPADRLEGLIRDADLSGLGRADYLARLGCLRDEWVGGRPTDSANDITWFESNVAFLRDHSYNTAAGERLFGDQKEENVALVEKKLKKAKKKIEKKAKKARKKAKKRAKKQSKTAIQGEKSAQMMLKTTLRNNIDLTSIADGKANIMLSINAVIITFGMPLLAAYIPQYLYLAVPGGFLLATCIGTITYATLATRPIKTSGVTDLGKLGNGRTNLFFFGNYYNMRLEDYKRGMTEVLRDQEILDSSVVNDLYWLGVALGHKFNRLRKCYLWFLVGMVLTILAFVFTFLYTGPLTERGVVPANILAPVDSLNLAL